MQVKDVSIITEILQWRNVSEIIKIINQLLNTMCFLDFQRIMSLVVVNLHLCGISRFRETMELRSNGHMKAAGGGVEAVIAVLAHTGVTVSIANDPCEDALSRCRCPFFFLSNTLHPFRKHRFFTHLSSPRCKSCLQYERSLETFSHLSMSIALISI